MNVGSDGVLLGAWASHPSPERILDIGAGSGLISLMLAQRFAQARITGIEIDTDAAQQAGENVAESEFSGRVNIIQSSLQNFQDAEKFDLIVCNPPFFKVSSVSDSDSRNTARQTGKLSPEELLEKASMLLTDSGHFCMVFPAEVDFTETAAGQGLFVQKKLLLKGNVDAPLKRIFWQFGKESLELTEETLILESSRNVYTEEAKALLNNFYLHL